MNLKGLKRIILGIVIVFVFSFLCWMQLECSSFLPIERLLSILSIKKEYILETICIYISIVLFFGTLTNRFRIVSVIVSIVNTVLSVANYYVIMYHGSPLNAFEIMKIGTAADVASNYSYVPNRDVLLLLGITVLQLLIAVFLMPFLRGREALNERAVPLLSIALAIFVGANYVATYDVDSKTSWSWIEDYSAYGTVACVKDSFISMKNLKVKPEGYSKEKLSEISLNGPSESTKQQPDIILILNESFYDLKTAEPNIKTDKEYLEHFQSLDNAIHGFSLVPRGLGGTNESEYELLTSNTIFLLNRVVSPFMIMDLNGAGSVVSVLKKQGYITYAMHPSSNTNYNRNVAYPAMGFDHSYFIDDFENITTIGKRGFASDASTYENLIRWYEDELKSQEESGNNQPVFMYCLTIQNHGGYETNSPEQDTVHVENDYGEYTDDVNEYLSVLSESDKEFAKLVDYYKKSERPVYICMMGDHSPLFTDKVIDYQSGDDYINVRKTPFVIWSNTDIEDRDEGTVNIGSLVPLMLEQAGVSIPPWYQFILNTRESYYYYTVLPSYLDRDNKWQEPDFSKRNTFRDFLYLSYSNIMMESPENLWEVKAP